MTSRTEVCAIANTFACLFAFNLPGASDYGGPWQDGLPEMVTRRAQTRSVPTCEVPTKYSGRIFHDLCRSAVHNMT